MLDKKYAPFSVPQFVHYYGEESWGFVYLVDNKYDVYENHWGNTERYQGTRDTLDEAIEFAKSFT